MNLESYLAMSSALLALLSLRLKKWLKQRKKLSVNFQTGNGTSLTVKTTSSSSEDQKKED